jgi:Transposase
VVHPEPPRGAARAPLLRASSGGVRPRALPLRPRDLTPLRQNGSFVSGRPMPPKEAFQQLWYYSSATWAGKFLDEWCRQVMRSRIEPMKNIARSLREHRQLILNYFRAQKMLSSGVVEGLNNKAKVTMRKSLRGFAPSVVSNLRSITHLANCPNPSPPTNFSEESEIQR